MKFEKHLVTSIPLTAIVYLYFKSKIMALWFFIGYIFIDIDHLLDYFITCGGINLNIRQFFDMSYRHKYKTLVLFFHSYELFVLFWFYVYIFNIKGGAFLGVLLGSTVHLIFDNLTNPVCPLGYFLIFRLFKKFQAKRLWNHNLLKFL